MTLASQELGPRSTATLVNVHTTSVATGQAVIGLILAQAFERDHLRSNIQSFQYDSDFGVGILMKDAGSRQHLASALGFDRAISAIKDGNRTIGAARKGHLLGVQVTVWDREI